MPDGTLFNSFWIGGLECSSHRLGSGKRLDLLHATRHDEFYEADYARLKAHGFATIRSGLRWHRIEQPDGSYDFSSVIPMIRAAQRHGIQVIWDICHYGWPDDIDLMAPEFVRRFARLAGAFGHVIREETDQVPFIAPINEISFFSWGAADAGYLNPFYRGHGFELKVQLVRAAIAGIEAIWDAAPNARIVHVDPVINIVADPQRSHEQHIAEGHRQAQYQAWDMLAGRSWPQVGGDPKYLDIIGVNYYPDNQWIHGGPTVHHHDPLYRPFREILLEVYERYQRPLLIGETGTEGDLRPVWLRYIGQEAAAAIGQGVPLHGLCLYPIFNHPGWDNDRHCDNGLWDYADDHGHRPIFSPLADQVHESDRAIRAAQSEQHAQTAQRGDRVQLIITDSQPARVCLFTDSLEASGMGEHMITLGAELQQQGGHTVTIVMPPDGPNDGLLTRAAAAGLRVLPLMVRGDGRQHWEQLRDFVRDHAIDIFHAHAGIGWEGHDGIFAAFFAQVPLLIRTEHLPWLITDFEQKRLYRNMADKLDQVICVSDESCLSYQKAGAPRAKLSVVRNGVAFVRSERTATAVRQSLSIPPDSPLILTVGRLTEQKGHRYLLEAIPAILTAYPKARFVWAGDGPLYSELCARLEQMHLTDRVLMLGWRSDVRDLIAAADLFVLPSLFEGLPLVVLEAIAAGTPVIATRAGGTPEIFMDTLSAALVSPGNSAALATAIVDALARPDLRRAWAAAGRARFADTFSAGRMAAETGALYRRLLAAKFAIAQPPIQSPPLHAIQG